MARIKNTSAYPNIPPTSGDYFVVTDVTNSDATKTVTIGSLSNFLNGGAEAEVVLDSTEIKNINTVAQLLPVLDQGTALVVPITAAIYYKAGSEPFNFPPGSKIRIQPQVYTNPSLPICYFEFDATLLNTSTSTLISPTNKFSDLSKNYSAITPTIDSETFLQGTLPSTQGNGTLRITFQYRLISTT